MNDRGSIVRCSVCQASSLSPATMTDRVCLSVQFHLPVGHYLCICCHCSVFIIGVQTATMMCASVVCGRPAACASVLSGMHSSKMLTTSNRRTVIIRSSVSGSRHTFGLAGLCFRCVQHTSEHVRPLTCRVMLRHRCSCHTVV